MNSTDTTSKFRSTIVLQTSEGRRIGTAEALASRAHNENALITTIRRDAAETLRSDDAKKIGELLQTALHVLRDQPLPLVARDFHVARYTIVYRTHVVIAPEPAKYLFGELAEVLDECPPPGTPKNIVDAVIKHHHDHLTKLKKTFRYTRQDYERLIEKVAGLTDNQAWHVGLAIALMRITDEIVLKKGWADKILSVDPVAVGLSFLSFRNAFDRNDAGEHWEGLVPTLTPLNLDTM